MQVGDVTATLDLALSAAGLDQMQVVHRPRLLTDNWSSYVAGDVLRKLRSEGCVAGPFGQKADAFARSVAAAWEARRTDTRGFPDQISWHQDPRVLAALITLEEDR